MKPRLTLRPTASVAGLLAVAMATSSCARLVTLSPKEAAANNDIGWKVRSAPPPEPSPPVTPIGSAAPIAIRDRPDVRQALTSPPDSLGIPTALYEADPILTAHRNEMRAESHARAQVSTGLIIMGLAFGALSAWFISKGVNETSSPDQNMRNAGSQIVFWGSLTGAISLGEIIAGTVMACTSPNPTPLTVYYRETYGESR